MAVCYLIHGGQKGPTIKRVKNSDREFIFLWMICLTCVIFLSRAVLVVK